MINFAEAIIDKFPDFDSDMSVQWQLRWFEDFLILARLLMEAQDR